MPKGFSIDKKGFKKGNRNNCINKKNNRNSLNMTAFMVSAKYC